MRMSKETKQIRHLAMMIVDAWHLYKEGSMDAIAYNKIRNDTLVFASLYLKDGAYARVQEIFRLHTDRECLPE